MQFVRARLLFFPLLLGQSFFFALPRLVVFWEVHHGLSEVTIKQVSWAYAFGSESVDEEAAKACHARTPVRASL